MSARAEMERRIGPLDTYFPTLSDAGVRLLRRMHTHRYGPVFHDRSGHRLLEADVRTVRDHERETLWRSGTIEQHAETLPDWLADFVDDCRTSVPFHRERLIAGMAFAELPTSTRADLATHIADCVPDDAPLERMIAYTTSGTTGHPLRIPSHPRVAAKARAYHARALKLLGVDDLEAGAGEVGIALVGLQKRCFTYVSVVPHHGDCGLVKLNLDPGDWTHADDRAIYLDDLAPELISGDPISLTALAELPLRHRPKALISTSMALSAGLREQLERRFECPVSDVYAMNEAGPIGVYSPAHDAHLLLQRGLYVELLDAEGRPVPDGERGEITLTGGFNAWLPLLRYRTGDTARRVRTPLGDGLRDLVGRPPVRYRTHGGTWINNVDVVHALRHLALPRYALHQGADAALVLWLPQATDAGTVTSATAALHALFGEGTPLTTRGIGSDDTKLVQFTSALAGSAPDARR